MHKKYKGNISLRAGGVIVMLVGILGLIIAIVCYGRLSNAVIWICIFITLLGIALAFSNKMNRSPFDVYLNTSADALNESDVTYNDIQLAIEANKKGLKNEFHNIVRIYPAYHIESDNRMPCADICISDTDTQNLPAFLAYTRVDGTPVKLKTRIITNFKNAKPHVGKGGFIANADSPGYLGTVGCILSSDSNPGQSYLLTCNHVMTGGSFQNPGNIGSNVVKENFGTYTNIGSWQSGVMNNAMDAAIISIDATEPTDPNNITLPVYTTSDSDCSVTQIELVGAISGTQRAYIIHIGQSMQVDYDETVEINNLITLSTTINSNNFTAASQEGDSGSLVYHATTLQPIAMVIGANSHLTFAIPITSVLNAFPTFNLSINN